jgi:hypothetical protein
MKKIGDEANFETQEKIETKNLKAILSEKDLEISKLQNQVLYFSLLIFVDKFIMQKMSE